MPAKHTTAEKLCLTCGLCCNGVIFADVQLQPGDDCAKLEALGLAITAFSKRRAAQNRLPNRAKAAHKFTQPCTAFDGCRCRIYADRPTYCRTFECLLLQSVNEGEVTTSTALKTIEKARRRAEKVRQLLRKLGDHDEKLALALRFRQMSQRIHKMEPDERSRHLFGELTLAFHELNLLLSQRFYPA